MFTSIHRNNRLFMLGNFLFALSYGLWMNLRQLHLGDLGATSGEVGSVLGIVAIAGALLPLPAGLLTDRIGAKWVILGAWIFAAIGTLIAVLATGWSLAPWLAGQLYQATPTHHLPFMGAMVLILPLLAVWLTLPLVQGTSKNPSPFRDKITARA